MSGIVLVVDPADAWLVNKHLHRALVDHMARSTVTVPPQLVDLAHALNAILSQPRPQTANPPADDAAALQGALMTYKQAADDLGVSTRTIGRHVAAGRLSTVGRRITRGSVSALGKNPR